MFAENVRTGRERNSQLCIYVKVFTISVTDENHPFAVKGEKVVDLYGSAEGDPGYNADSLQCIYRFMTVSHVS